MSADARALRSPPEKRRFAPQVDSLSRPSGRPIPFQLERTKIMTMKSMEAFFEKVSQDKSLQAQLTALHKQILKDSKETSATQIVKIAAASGYKFTVKDWNQEKKARAKKASKAELVDVTGQMWCEGWTYDNCTSNELCNGSNWY
jgi:predicted ribosomally synthesized peptide with nif11-like leader